MGYYNSKMEEKKIDYYEVDAISNSHLGSFDYLGPKQYKKLLDLNKLSSKTSYFGIGDAIHTKLLEPNKFNDKFVISNCKVIDGLMGEFIKLYVKASINDIGIINFLNIEKDREFLHQLNDKAGFKQSIDTTWKQLQKDENQEYIYFLIESNDKIILSQEDIIIVDNCVDSIKNHKVAGKLLDDINSYNELEIYWKQKDVKLKSKLDKVIIDKIQKVVIIPDIKSTSKSINNFKNTFDFYKIYRQLAFYIDAIKYYMRNTLKIDPIEYIFSTYIIAVQTTNGNTCKVFYIDNKYLIKGYKEYDTLLNKIIWHTMENKWDYDMEYYIGDGIETLLMDDDGGKENTDREYKEE